MSASLSDNTANAGTFQYTGLSKLDKRSPKFRLLVSQKEMRIREFVCFYCGIDEDAVHSAEDEGLALTSYILPFEKMIAQKMVLRSSDFGWWSDEPIEPDSSCIHSEWKFDSCVLEGYESINEFQCNFEILKFPVEAFISYLLSENLPIPECWQEKASAMVASQQNDAQESPSRGLNEVSPNGLANDGDEIAEGVTVADIRAMIDPKAPTYCPRLLASILTKKELMPKEAVLLKRETVYKAKAKDCSVTYLRKLGVINGNEKNKFENPEPSNEDIKAVARILCRTPDYGNGRPRES